MIVDQTDSSITLCILLLLNHYVVYGGVGGAADDSHLPLGGHDGGLRAETGCGLGCHRKPPSAYS